MDIGPFPGYQDDDSASTLQASDRDLNSGRSRDLFNLLLMVFAGRSHLNETVDSDTGSRVNDEITALKHSIMGFNPLLTWMASIFSKWREMG